MFIRTPRKRLMYGAGKLSIGKGTKLFLESIQYLSSSIEIIICGSGSMEEEVKRYIENDTKHKIVFFKKLVHDKFLELLETCDVSVSCSISADSLPRVALESLSLGVPVVACNHSGYLDLIDDGKNGFLVNEDPKELAEAICKILGMKIIEKEFDNIWLSQNNKRIVSLIR